MFLHSDHHPRTAFTLIELLVVISIIALLIAILLPTLQAARLAGRVTVCLSNQRQLAIGLSSYAFDYDGYMPSIGGNSRPHRVIWNDSDPNEQSVLGALARFEYVSGGTVQWKPNTVTAAFNEVFHCPTRSDEPFALTDPAPLSAATADALASQSVTFFRFAIDNIVKLDEPFIDRTGNTYQFNSNRPILVDAMYDPTAGVPGTGPVPVHGQQSLSVTYNDGHGKQIKLDGDRYVYRGISGAFNYNNFVRQELNGQ